MAVPVPVDVLQAMEGRLGSEMLLEHPPHALDVVIEHELVRRFAEHLLGLVPEQILDLWIGVDIDAPVVDLPYPVAGGLDH